MSPTQQRANSPGGWSQEHYARNHNNFYDAHPQLHQPYVPVVLPNEARDAYKWQASVQMLSSMPENAHIADLLRCEPAPSSTLDIGCGIGRATVWLAKYYGWRDATLHMLDSTGNAPAWGVDERGRDDFYNDLRATRAYLEANGLAARAVYLDARTWDPERVAGPVFDFVYSFMAFGFHWDFNFWLDRVKHLIAPGALCVFGTRGYDAGKNGYRARRFTNRQLASLDKRAFAIVRDARTPEREKSSVVVLRRKRDGKRARPDDTYTEEA